MSAQTLLQTNKQTNKKRIHRIQSSTNTPLAPLSFSLPNSFFETPFSRQNYRHTKEKNCKLTIPLPTSPSPTVPYQLSTGSPTTCSTTTPRPCPAPLPALPRLSPLPRTPPSSISSTCKCSSPQSPPSTSKSSISMTSWVSSNSSSSSLPISSRSSSSSNTRWLASVWALPQPHPPRLPSTTTTSNKDKPSIMCMSLLPQSLSFNNLNNPLPCLKNPIQNLSKNWRILS